MGRRNGTTPFATSQVLRGLESALADSGLVQTGAKAGEESDREPEYIQPMRKLFIALAVTALLALILIVGGTAQNQGCLPWKTPVHVGGSVFSEGDRGHTYCK